MDILTDPCLLRERLELIGTQVGADVLSQRIPGAVVLVSQHNRSVYFEAFGFQVAQQRQAMPRDAIFCLASMTKLFTSVAAMILVEQGRLALDAPVHTYLPALAGLHVSVEGTDAHTGAVTQQLVAATRAMTILDLLRHTSGLTYADSGSSLVHQAYGREQIGCWEHSNAELVQRLARLPLVCHPGTRFEYGLSTDVLGHVVEVVSDMPLDAFIEQHVCQPLALGDTGFSVADSKLGRLALPLLPPGAQGAQGEEGLDLARPQRARWLSGGGGLFSTASDVERFMRMLLGGGALDGVRILATATVRAMTSNQLPADVAYGRYTQTLQSTAPTPQMGQGFGLGVAVRIAAHTNPLPGSVGDFSWAGLSGTYAWADPVENLVAVLMLRAPAERVRYRALMRQLVYQALPGRAPYQTADSTITGQA